MSIKKIFYCAVLSSVFLISKHELKAESAFSKYTKRIKATVILKLKKLGISPLKACIVGVGTAATVIGGAVFFIVRHKNKTAAAALLNATQATDPANSTGSGQNKDAAALPTPTKNNNDDNKTTTNNNTSTKTNPTETGTPTASLTGTTTGSQKEQDSTLDQTGAKPIVPAPENDMVHADKQIENNNTAIEVPAQPITTEATKEVQQNQPQNNELGGTNAQQTQDKPFGDQVKDQVYYLNDQLKVVRKDWAGVNWSGAGKSLWNAATKGNGPSKSIDDDAQRGL